MGEGRGSEPRWAWVRPAHQPAVASQADTASKARPLARTENAQILWATTCSGDQGTQPPDMVSARCPPSPKACQPAPLASGVSPAWAPSPFLLPYPGEEEQGCQGDLGAGVLEGARGEGTGQRLGGARTCLASEVSRPLPGLQEKQRQLQRGSPSPEGAPSA